MDSYFSVHIPRINDPTPDFRATLRSSAVVPLQPGARSDRAARTTEAASM